MVRKLGALVLIRGSDAVLVGNTSLSAVTDIGTGGIGFAPTLRRTAVESSSDWALQISRCFTAMGGERGRPVEGLGLTVGSNNLRNEPPSPAPHGWNESNLPLSTMQ